jgi:hypothetical protein
MLSFESLDVFGEYTKSLFVHNGLKYTARIFKLLRSPGIDSKESIPPAYVVWRAGTTTPFPARFLAPIVGLKIPAQAQ